MDFFINKKATLPIMKLELIKDGRNDFHKFHEMIQNSDIYFCMSELETGKKVIGKAPALCILKEPLYEGDDCTEEEYYLAYQFSEKETKKAGTYVGEFIIEFLDGSGTLKVPIRDTLYVHVRDHGIKK
jgi:hypothetical protein